jgi:hypothetical protein
MVPGQLAVLGLTVADAWGGRKVMKSKLEHQSGRLGVYGPCRAEDRIRPITSEAAFGSLSSLL